MSLIVACWFAAIGAFRSSLLFRLLDVVPLRCSLEFSFNVRVRNLPFTSVTNSVCFFVLLVVVIFHSHVTIFVLASL